MERKGFTLVELLVVIAVTALLLGILMPVLNRARRQAKAVVCRSNLRQWGKIFRMYSNDNNGENATQGWYGYGIPDPWMRSMKGYCKGTEGINCCPMAGKPTNPDDGLEAGGSGGPGGGGAGVRTLPRSRGGPGSDGGGAVTGGRGARGGTLLAWGKLKVRVGDEWTEDYYGSYGINNWLCVPDESGSWIVGGLSLNVGRNFWRTPDVGSASEIPMCLDSWWYCAWVKDTDTPGEWDCDRRFFPCGCTNSIHRFCINRHDGFVNAVFMDCSVRRVGLKELWTLKWHREFNTANRWTPAGGARPEDWPKWMRRFRDD